MPASALSVCGLCVVWSSCVLVRRKRKASGLFRKKITRHTIIDRNLILRDKYVHTYTQQAVQEAATICSRPCKFTFDLLTLKVVSESPVTWATSMPILVFLGLSVLDLGQSYATDRQTDRQTDVRLQTRIIA